MCIQIRQQSRNYGNHYRKYKIDKKFVLGHFLDYEMVDSKIMVSQVQELQVVLHEIHVKGMM